MIMRNSHFIVDMRHSLKAWSAASCDGGPLLHQGIVRSRLQNARIQCSTDLPTFRASTMACTHSRPERDPNATAILGRLSADFLLLPIWGKPVAQTKLQVDTTGA